MPPLQMSKQSGLRIRSNSSVALDDDTTTSKGLVLERGSTTSTTTPPISYNSEISTSAISYSSGNSILESDGSGTAAACTVDACSKKKLPILPVVALTLSQFLFSGWHVLGAQVLHSAPGLHVGSFTVIRQIFSYIVLLIASRWKEGHIPFPQKMNLQFKIVAAGVCGGSLMPLFYLSGLIHTTPTVTAVWDGPFLPVLVFIATLFLGIERLSAKPLQQISSLLLTVMGSLLVLVGDFHHHKAAHMELETWHDGRAHEFLLGNALLFAMILSYAAMAMIQKDLSEYFLPLTLTSWIFGVGAVANVLLVVFVGKYLPGGAVTLMGVYEETRHAMATSTTFIMGLLYAVFCLTALCNSVLSYASKYLDSSLVVLFCALQPPITVVMEYFAFNKAIGAKKIIGMIAVGIGMVYFTSYKKEGSVTHSRGSSPSYQQQLSTEKKEKDKKMKKNISFSRLRRRPRNSPPPRRLSSLVDVV